MKRFIQKGIEAVKGIDERSRQREAARYAGQLAARRAEEGAQREEAEKKREKESLLAVEKLLTLKDKFVIVTNPSGAPDTQEQREDFHRPLAQAIHDKFPTATTLTTSYLVGFRSNPVRKLQKGIGIVGEELGKISNTKIDISNNNYDVGRTAYYDSLLTAVEQGLADQPTDETAHIVVISASVIKGINLEYGPSTGGVAFAATEAGDSGHIQWEKLSEQPYGNDTPHNIND